MHGKHLQLNRKAANRHTARKTCRKSRKRHTHTQLQDTQTAALQHPLKTRLSCNVFLLATCLCIWSRCKRCSTRVAETPWCLVIRLFAMCFCIIYATRSYISVRNRLALSAHDGPNLAALWPWVEVITGALEGDSLHTAFNTNLGVKNLYSKHLLCENGVNCEQWDRRRWPVCEVVPSRRPEMRMDCSPVDKGQAKAQLLKHSF